MKITEIDALTGISNNREATEEEIATLTQDDAEAKAVKVAAEALLQSKRSKLLALGLTEEELDA